VFKKSLTGPTLLEMSDYGVYQNLRPIPGNLLPKVISKHFAARRDLFPPVPFGAGDGHLYGYATRRCKPVICRRIESPHAVEKRTAPNQRRPRKRGHGGPKDQEDTHRHHAARRPRLWTGIPRCPIA
jgi:hypothetical protein